MICAASPLTTEEPPGATTPRLSEEAALIRRIRLIRPFLRCAQSGPMFRYRSADAPAGFTSAGPPRRAVRV
jgi:hypothetical protein